MSYFPTDIPFMSDEELIENGLKKPYKKPEIIKGTDLVPVVRCKDCNFARMMIFAQGEGFLTNLCQMTAFVIRGKGRGEQDG